MHNKNKQRDCRTLRARQPLLYALALYGKIDMIYDLHIHKHNFSAWAAARAAQRGFTTSTILIAALETSNVQNYLPDPSLYQFGCEKFDELHRRWCRSIVNALLARNVASATWGRAAKLLAIYLKSMVIVGNDAYSSFARCIHPPIDRRLLQAVAADSSHPEKLRRICQQTNWTQLTEQEYYDLIQQLRAALPPEMPFWMLESYWTPADDEE